MIERWIWMFSGFSGTMLLYVAIKEVPAI